MGCQIPARLNNFDLSVRTVTKALGIELVDLLGAGCCGFPLRSADSKVATLMAARNLALAEKTGLELMVVCNSCYATLVETMSILKEDPAMAGEIAESLEKEGLRYEGRLRVRNMLQVLYYDYGIEKVGTGVKRSLKDLKVAVHYGCHLLRPSRKVQFDNAENPHILDELVEKTGAKSVYWPLKLWCCSAPTLPYDERLALGLAGLKLRDAKDSGADCIVTPCPSCLVVFDTLQPRIARLRNEQYNLPVLYYAQLLGLAMGLSPKELGLNLNRTPVEPVTKILA